MVLRFCEFMNKTSNTTDLGFKVLQCLLFNDYSHLVLKARITSKNKCFRDSTRGKWLTPYSIYSYLVWAGSIKTGSYSTDPMPKVAKKPAIPQVRQCKTEPNMVVPQPCNLVGRPTKLRAKHGSPTPGVHRQEVNTQEEYRIGSTEETPRILIRLYGGMTSLGTLQAFHHPLWHPSYPHQLDLETCQHHKDRQANLHSLCHSSKEAYLSWRLYSQRNSHNQVIRWDILTMR